MDSMIEIENAVEQYVLSCYKLSETEPTFRELDLYTKVVYGKAFGRAEGTGVKVKEMEAFASPKYEEHIKKVSEAQREFIVDKYTKQAMEARFETARSLNSLEKIKLEQGL